MLCIASFFVFIVLGIFSAYYRELAKKAWYCVGRRLTLKPCDINFSQEIKGKLIGKMIFTHPRLAKFIGKWIDWIAFGFVIVTLWSIFSVFLTGLNLLVYDTCNPAAPESCSLGGESCGIGITQLSLSEAVKAGKITEWLTSPFTTFADTVSRVPARFQSWNAKSYTSSGSTYYYPFDSSKETALEIIDPGCVYCQKLFKNITQAGFEKTHNLTYIAYPIPDKTTPSGTKFPYSMMIASYLEAVKQVPLKDATSSVSPDWQLLEYIFTGKDGADTDLQYKINFSMKREEVLLKLHEILQKIGYTTAEIQEIDLRTDSAEVQSILQTHRDIVEKQIRTLKIPTIIFGGRRYDRVIDVEQLRK